MPLRFSLLLQLWGGGVALSQGGPPAVSPGTAANTCQRILDAGYSPHDYIYRVTASRLLVFEGGGIDYFIDLAQQKPVEGAGGPVTVYSIYSRTPGDSASRVKLHTDHLIEPTNGLSDFTRARLGEILDIDTGSSPVSADAASDDALYRGHAGYIWRPVSGEPDIIYRDVLDKNDVTIVETEWAHDPSWSGPEAARMSSIWGSVSECAR